MTEKRFERVYGDIEVVCIDHQKTGDDKFIDDGDYDKFVDLLNDLSKENEQLKKDNKEYIRGLELSKTTSQSWASDVRELRKENYRLEEENEQLKQQVEDLEFALRTKLAYQRVEKEEHSDSVYDFKKKLDKW